MAGRTPPPDSEIFTLDQLLEKHPLLTRNRLQWMARNRHVNGLARIGGVFKSPASRGLLFHEPTVMRWVLGLKGRAKLRKKDGDGR